MKECYQLTDEDFDTSIFMHCENIKSKVEEKAIQIHEPGLAKKIVAEEDDDSLFTQVKLKDI